MGYFSRLHLVKRLAIASPVSKAAQSQKRYLLTLDSFPRTPALPLSHTALLLRILSRPTFRPGSMFCSGLLPHLIRWLSNESSTAAVETPDTNEAALFSFLRIVKVQWRTDRWRAGSPHLVWPRVAEAALPLNVPLVVFLGWLWKNRGLVLLTREPRGWKHV